jgi:hypothetical protein
MQASEHTVIVGVNNSERRLKLGDNGWLIFAVMKSVERMACDTRQTEEETDSPKKRKRTTTKRDGTAKPDPLCSNLCGLVAALGHNESIMASVKGWVSSSSKTAEWTPIVQWDERCMGTTDTAKLTRNAEIRTHCDCGSGHQWTWIAMRSNEEPTHDWFLQWWNQRKRWRVTRNVGAVKCSTGFDEAAAIWCDVMHRKNNMRESLTSCISQLNENKHIAKVRHCIDESKQEAIIIAQCG